MHPRSGFSFLLFLLSFAVAFFSPFGSQFLIVLPAVLQAVGIGLLFAVIAVW